MRTKNDVDEEHNRVVRIGLSVQTKNDVDEEHNRVVRIGLSEGYRCRPRTMWVKNITDWSGLGYRKAIDADQERCG